MKENALPATYDISNLIYYAIRTPIRILRATVVENIL